MTSSSKQLKHKSFITFILISFIYAILSFLFNHFVYTDDVYINTLNGDFAIVRINDLLNQQRRLQWIGYIAIPLVILFKIFFSAACILIYNVLYSVQIKWKQIFKIVLEAEAIFLIPLILKLIWFSFFPPQTIEQVSGFAPWSLVVLAGENTPVYLKYVLQTVNVFEIIYWILLAIGICSATQFSFSKSLGIVAKSYGIGLALWIVFVTFLLVQLS